MSHVDRIDFVCAGALMNAVFYRSGFKNFLPVPQQYEPHPMFPTVKAPNPENKDSLDMALEKARADRYAGWKTPAAQAMLKGGLADAAARVTSEGLEPQPKSGRQERLENLWNRFV